MELDVMREALKKAEAGLAEAEEQFIALQSHKGRLQDVVSSLRTLLDAEGNESNIVSYIGNHEHRRPLHANPTWSKAGRALKEIGKPATVPEIHEQLARTGTPPSADALRIAMLRKPELFGRVGAAYELRRGVFDAMPQMNAEEATEVAP